MDVSHPPSREPFQICLLGGMQIVYRGAALSLPPYRTHSLFAALLLHPQPWQRERLGMRLFPEIPESDGRRRLSDLLWLLRRALPELPLETTAQEVFLPPESRRLDVEAFREAAATKDVARWQAALALYRGELLAGVYADWLLEEREHIHLQYIRLLYTTCDHLMQAQRFEEAAPLAERLLIVEPYDESALRVLMRTHQALGRRGAALAAYERFVALAADELGVTPEPATISLAESLRSAALPVTPAPLAPDGAPDELRARARQALDQGDRATLSTCLAQLRAQHPADECSLRALEVDAALLEEDCARAERLLAGCTATTAPLLVRAARLAVARRQRAEAADIAAQALVRAGDEQDVTSELEALLILAQLQCESGKGVPAARTAQRALSLAHASASPAYVAAAQMVFGRLQIALGNHAEALRAFHETRALAQEHTLRPILAEALYRASTIYCGQGKLAEALGAAREAVSLCRDLGLQRREIYMAQSLALYHALLGDSAECLRIVERVGALSEALEDPLRIAIHRYHLADTLIYHNDALAPRAIGTARAALAVFREHDQLDWIASTLSTLSCALWLEGRHAEALSAALEAEMLHRRLEELDYLPGLLAQQGLIHLSLNAPDKALACTREALHVAMLGSPVHDALPEVYYAYAMALLAHEDEAQADDYLKRAYQHLVNEAAQHSDEDARQALFHRSPITRRLMAELTARGLAPAAEAAVITRRLPATHGKSPVAVRWTVDAGPADAALKHAQGAIALRRARLARLLQEAEAQGARPTVAQLAEALDVSLRTLKRDLAALRRG
ncbi:MAG: hypothetical protein JXA21_08875 [Anaerolineae bacterium]|nr:hypothetical protein [Anaerolineae bacterium]